MSACLCIFVIRSNSQWSEHRSHRSWRTESFLPTLAPISCVQAAPEPCPADFCVARGSCVAATVLGVEIEIKCNLLSKPSPQIPQFQNTADRFCQCICCLVVINYSLDSLTLTIFLTFNGALYLSILYSHVCMFIHSQNSLSQGTRATHSFWSLCFQSDPLASAIFTE